MRNSEFFLGGWLKALLCAGFGRSIRCKFFLRRTKTKETGFLRFMQVCNEVFCEKPGF